MRHAESGQRRHDPDPELTVSGLDHGVRQPVRYPRGAAQPRFAGYTAFVLSGGGARGALQVGALRALLEHGERPDAIVGTSIGAWNGAWLARTPTLAGVESLAEAWRHLTTARVLLGRDLPANYPRQALTGMLMITAFRRMSRGSASLYPNTGLRQLLERYLGGVRFDDLELPFRVVATDLSRGERAVFESGPVVPALLASSAIPGVFPPVRIGDGVYADGGAVDACSLETALALGARRLFLLAIGHDVSEDGGAEWLSAAHDGDAANTTPARTVAAVLERASQVMSHYQLARVLERLPRGVEAHVICLSTGDGYGSLDFANTSGWIERAYRSTRDYLQTHLPQVGAARAADADVAARASVAS